MEFEPVNTTPPSNPIKTVFQTFSVFIFGGIGLLIMMIGFFIYNIFSGLPDITQLSGFRHPVASQVLSDEGKLIAEFTTERRYSVKFEEIPKHVIQAFVSAEDSKFFEHQGIDYNGIFRAVFSNLLKGRYAQGGSTITQQVARSILLTRKKELTRKIREMILAVRMEKQLSKNEIMNLYLNEIYLGHGAFGIGAAAQNYFRKNVHDISIAEAAMLAGFPQRPNEWNPFKNPHLAKRRQSYVLRRMVDDEYITKEQAEKAFAQDIKLYTLEDPNLEAAPFFSEHVRQLVMTKYGSEKVLSEGYKIHTTLRYDMQKAAEGAVLKGLREVDKRLGWRRVTKKLQPPEIEEFQRKNHEQILEKVTDARLLTVNAENTQKLEYELSKVQKESSPYFGPTPLKESEYYQGVVESIDEKENVAFARVGQTPVRMAWANLSWVAAAVATITPPVPADKIPKKVSDVISVGEQIQIKVVLIDKKRNLIEGSLEQEPEIQGALLSFDIETGQVRAMVGGRSFVQSKFNCALQAKRQVGSTFKPIIYAAALDKGFSPSSIVTDAPIVFKFEGGLDADNTGEDWRPHNYSGTFEGDIPLRLALIRSMNIPTVKVLNEVGIDYGIQYARQLGITAPLPRDLSIALGSWSSSLEEVLKAYSVFPRLGETVQLSYIKKIVNGKGEVIEEDGVTAGAVKLTAPPPTVSLNSPLANEAEKVANAKTLISPQTAYVMTDLLRGAIREGTGRAAAYVSPYVAGKTGTSNDHRDAWFVGYTPNLIAGVWLGYEKDKPLNAGETGGRAAAPIWAEYMTKSLGQYPRADFPIPDDVVFAYVDRTTGKLANTKNSNRVRVAFKSGSVPNSNGDNIARIGEPGERMMSQTPTPSDEAEGFEESKNSKEEETSDYLSKGYEE